MPIVTDLVSLTFSNNSFRNTFRVSNGLDLDQNQCTVGPNLGSNCLQILAADEKKWRLAWKDVMLFFFFKHLMTSADFCKLTF